MLKITKKDFKVNFTISKKQSYQMVVALVVIIILMIGFALWRKKHTQQNEKKEAAVELSDQYRKQLPDLKNRAQSNSANDLQNYGIALYATGNLSEAEQVYKKQIEVDPNNSVAHNNLANTLRDEKKFEEAANEYEAAIKLSPRALNSYTNLGSLYQYSLGDLNKAIDVYQRASDAIADSADINVLLALAYEQKKDFANAEKSFEKVLSLQSDNQVAKAGLDRLKNK